MDETKIKEQNFEEKPFVIYIPQKKLYIYCEANKYFYLISKSKSCKRFDFLTGRILQGWSPHINKEAQLEVFYQHSVEFLSVFNFDLGCITKTFNCFEEPMFVMLNTINNQDFTQIPLVPYQEKQKKVPGKEIPGFVDGYDRLSAVNEY